MRKFIKINLLVQFLVVSLTIAQNHKIGGKLAVGIDPLIFGTGFNYSYIISDDLVLRTNFNASIIMSSKSVQLYRNDNLYMIDFGVQGFTNPFNKDKDCYLGAGVGYYIISGDGTSGNGPEFGNGYVKSEDFSNTIGFDLFIGYSLSNFFLIEFDYLLLFPNQILTIEDPNTFEQSTIKQSLNLSSGRLNFIFTFNL